MVPSLANGRSHHWRRDGPIPLAKLTARWSHPTGGRHRGAGELNTSPAPAAGAETGEEPLEPDRLGRVSAPRGGPTNTSVPPGAAQALGKKSAEFDAPRSTSRWDPNWDPTALHMHTRRSPATPSHLDFCIPVHRLSIMVRKRSRVRFSQEALCSFGSAPWLGRGRPGDLGSAGPYADRCTQSAASSHRGAFGRGRLVR